ncbi:hypothetical protein FRC07_010568 [Ceratobasidium sp. 392]|nr:hypothetical protein FRC07_010568 [Ceratobasidium sp. 392]
MSDSEEEVDRAEQKRRRKQSKKELQKALEASQRRELNLREEQQQQQPPQPQPNQDDAQGHKTGYASVYIAREQRKAAAARAGRRAGVLHVPFMDDDYLFDHRVNRAHPRILDDVVKAAADPSDPEAAEDEELADEDNPKKWWDVYRFVVPDAVDMAREIIYTMAPGLGKYWLRDWFQSSFLDGYRKIRSDVVFHIAKNHKTILGIQDERFRKKNFRITMPEVQELRDTFQYAYLPNGIDSDPTSLFRHDCIIRTVRYIYSGESAISTGERSRKARNAHSQLWRITEVTPSVIAFAVVAIDFVLSGASSFDPDPERLAFFQGRLTMMEDLYDRHPLVFADLMSHYNRGVLPHLYPPEDDGVEIDEDTHVPPPPPGLTQADVAFLKNM